MSLNSDFKELLNLLNESKAKYLIIGGYAVIEHTEPRYTKDLDIWISPDRTNAEKVYNALKRFGAPLSSISVEDFTNPEIVYHMGRPPARIDVLMGLKGLNFNECWERRLESNYGNTPTQFISAQDLIVNKQLAGRPQDLADVENLRLSQKQNIKKDQNAEKSQERESDFEREM